MTQVAVGYKHAAIGRERHSDGLWTHTGRMSLRGGPIDLPDGAITSQALAVGAAQSTPVAYVQLGGDWTNSLTGAWLATPIGVSVTCTGQPLRVEFMLTVRHSAANPQVNLAIGWDGTPMLSLGTFALSTAGRDVTLSGTYYVFAVSGTHNFQMFLINYTAGNLIISNSQNQLMYVTEQKR